MSHRRLALFVWLLLVASCIFSVQAFEQENTYPGTSTAPLIGAAGGVADAFWHLLLDGPMMLAEAVAGFTLSVTSAPSGASILLDGNDTGVTTPADISDVSVSVHNVTVALDGYLPGINETVEGAADGTTAVHFDLTAASGDEDPLEPSFSANTTSGTVPFAVAFTDESAGTPVEWFWEFGDGGVSVERNPVHTYADAGTYTVSLTVADANRTATAVREDYIEAAAPEEPAFAAFAAFAAPLGIPSPSAPTAAFSGTPTSGAAPLSVAFTDASTGDPTGWAWFFGDETYGEAWTEQTASAGWDARYDHTSVVLPDGSIVLMGGFDGNPLNDVWRSTDNGATWICVNTSAGWDARYDHTSVVMPDGSIVLMGGWDSTTSFNDVWQLTDSGATWTLVTEHAGWPARYGPTSVALADGSIVLMGGRSDTPKNDVWQSTDGGATWTEVNASAGWTARTYHVSIALPDGSIVLAGGMDGTFTMQNDTWRSTDGGTTWACVNASAGWPARLSPISVALPDGSIVLMGGSDGTTTFNDVWRSTDNGAMWTEVTANAGWPARMQHTSVALPDGSIVLMGGLDGTFAPLNDTWRLQPVGSPEQNPTHTYMTPGTYPVTLQAYNAGGYNASTIVDYITVSAPAPVPTANVTANVTTGTVPLAVQFNDTSTGNPTAWNWTFGDGSFSEEQNPVHTYASAGTYTVNLTAGNAGGTDTLSRAGYVTVTAPLAAAFNGTPRSGLAPLSVAFTDASTGDPTGWAWFFGDETYGEAWTEIETNAEWGQRVGHTSVTLPDGSIVLMGGQDFTATQRNDVWRSTDNGATWTQVNASAGWAVRSYHSSVALPDGSIVLMGGTGASGRLNDVWRSTDGGVTWTQVNASAGWEARSHYSSVALPDGGIVLMGGTGASGPLNDVWRSTDGGATWAEVNASAGWAARNNHASVALSNGGIILMGGQGATALNDVWRSTDAGATWTQLPDAGWSARTGHSSLTMPDGSIVLAGGMDTTFRNDVWRSTDGGATWTQLPDAGWPARGWYASVATQDGSILVMGGASGFGPRSDVWRVQPAGSSDQSPSHTYAEPGTYSVTLQAYNAGGYNASTAVDYITVLTLPTANFTANATAGTAPLAVQFNDTSAGSPTAWNWTFGDGSFSEEQNPVHTYTSAGTYTVNLTADNAGGTDTLSRTGYVTVTVLPPVAAFSGTPTSGPAPLTVQFTDASTGGTPTGWAWFFGDETYGEAWTEQNASAGWTGRWGHTSVVLPDGSIVLTGGYDSSGMRNDVWRSTDNGATWTCMNASAEWAARYLHASVAMPDGSIVIMGGFGKKDIWRSVDNGATWTCMNANAEWSTRCGQTSVAMPDGSIVLMGGMCGGPMSPIYKNDVWRSMDNGATWTCMNASAGWTGRESFTSAVLPDGSIVLVGGWDGSSRNDVWRSTDGGATWTCMNASAGWTARSKHTSVAMPDGNVILMGGQDASNNFKNDVWRSTDRGTTWTQINASPGWSSRDFPTAVTMPDGSIVLMGGSGNNDVWRFPPAGSSDQNVSHEYTAPGNYSVTLQAYNAGGYNASTAVDYITVVAAPTVTGIELDFGTAGSSDTTVRIVRGTGFAGTPTVALVNGGITIAAANITVVSDTKLTCTFDLAAAPAGAYDARVTTENGTGTLDDAFTAYTTLPAMFRADHYRSGIYPDTGAEIPGTVKWTFSTEGPVGYPSPVVYDGIVYIGSSDANVYAIDAATGVKMWNYTMENVVWSSACVSDGVVYVGSADNSLHAVDAATGIKVWNFTTGAAVQSSPSIRNGVAYVGSGDGNVYAVDAATGTKVWNFTTGDAVLSSPSVSDGVVYAGSYDNNVYAIDAATGMELWRFPTGNVVDSSPSVSDGIVYVGSGDGRVYALDAATGAQQWAFTTGAYVFSSPCVSDGVVYVGSLDNNTYALDAATGTELWTFATGDAVWSSPSVSDGVLYIGSCDTKVYALDAVTGMPKWNVTTGNAIYSSPCVIDGVVYVGSVDGKVYAIGPTVPAANFTANVTAGTAPFTVAFVDNSTGYPTAWNWDFGDGNTSTDRNATHTYANAGNYTVSLNASNAYGFNVSTISDAIQVLQAPAANFTATPAEGNAPLTVNFTDTSTGDITAWFWDFGDGNTSTEASPSHTYADAGTYVVSLNASNAYAFNVSTVPDAVRVLEAPAANFTATPDEGNAPLTVQFNDTSVGNVTAWSWDFGDGNASTDRNPSHTYVVAGTYTVSLNASNAYSLNTSTVPDAIQVLPAPVAGFTAVPEEGNAPLTVTFTDASTGNVTGWFWDLGDGNVSVEQNPIHTYASAGTYTVTLNASNAYGFNVSTVLDAVRVLEAPTAGFTFSPEEGNAPLAVQFNDTSSGNVTVWSWDFGDGNTSTDLNPSHTYASTGNYTITLNVSNAYGSDVFTVASAIRVLSAPVAGFTFAPSEGNAPLTVQFNDTSSGNVTAWSWNFGDGNVSSEQNPVHIYASAGTYMVSLNASNAYGFNVSTVADAVRALEAPAANFTYAPGKGNTPLTVQFNDTSIGNVTVRFWDFGDGNTSAEQNPVHVYATAGTYTVSLNASNAYGSNVSTVTDAVRVLDAPAANFTYTPGEGNAPLTVQFNDTSIGNVTTRSWDFGDGNTSTEQNPIHTYASAGTYTVSLNASNAYGFNVSTVTDAVQVLEGPAANFTYAPSEGNAPLAVQFNDTSAGNVTAWLWDFGDGQTSTEQNPEHLYADAGIYTVWLNASNAYGFNVSTVADAVRVLDAPAASFTYAPSEGNAPLTVQFNDTSIGNVTSWLWDFGDGNTSAEQNPEHLYPTAGTYTISLNASNAYGFNVSTVLDAVLALPAPMAGFTYTPDEGNAPLTVTFNDTSIGNVTAWSWDFGDGQTSADQNPEHLYANAGIYTVTLNASNAYGFNVSTVTDAVSVLPAPVAGFTFVPDEGNAPLTVTFTDASIGNVTAWTWDFGDGNTSTEMNPSHTYAVAGTYTVSLNTSNPFGSNVSTVADAVHVLPAPVAGFVYTPGEGNAPLTVQFNDTSAGNVTAWSWDFGDGQTSTEQNPEHLYANAGIYTVSLNASNVYGFNASTVTDAVQVLSAPAANFTLAPAEGNAPLTVTFTEASTGNVTAWTWDFGDGNTSTEQNPVHIYATAGTYTVTLNASNPYGFNVSTVTNAVRVLPAPAAGFTFTPDEGNAPLNVTFADASTGNVTTWSWNFGDGQTSTEQNPEHLYANAGIYTVTLNASNAYGFNVSTVTDAVGVLPAPGAGFTYAPSEGNAPLSVQFNDTSSGNVTEWTWDFGDGNVSSLQNPVHSYGDAGTYTVTLNASNPYGFNVSVVADAVRVLPAPVAGFTFVPDEGNAPLAVQFNDTSCGNVTAWAWDFGDGNTSVEANPLHTYANPGTYTVSLNASNAYGFNISTVTDAVQVLPAPVAGFTLAPSEGNAPLTVTFTDASSGNVTAWAWDFGDGNMSSLQNPVHTYANAGTYTVTLNASNAYGFNVSTVTDGVGVLPAPIAGFTCTPGEGNAPLTVQFNDASTGNVTGWTWDFGDGNTSAEQCPLHTYADAGIYTVTLNASNAYGSSVSVVADAVRVLPAPAAGFTFTPDEGNAPLAVQLTDTSAGNVTAWAWDFGDGETSNECNPVHTYATAGTYTVTLNASNVYGFDISTVVGAVNVLPAPVANFTYTPSEGNEPLAVTFTDTSTGNVTAWHWSFGDGTTSTERCPAHIYAPAGGYTVTLNVSNAYGWDTLTVPDAVIVTSHSRGGGGGGIAPMETPTPAPSPTSTSVSTPVPTPAQVPVAAELTTDTEGRVTETIEIVASDAVGMLTIPSGVQARDATGGHLREIIIVPTDTVNLTETHDVTENGTSAFLFGQYAYRVEPNGATFSPPITLTFNVPRDVWATLDTANMSIMWQDEESGAWEEIPIASIDGNTTHVWVRAAITHFSTYELFIPQTDQATPAVIPAETRPQFPFLLLIIILIVVGTALYVWRKQRQNR